MPKEKQREIARLGGKAAHKAGTAHKWTPEEAREAGRKGGRISRGGKGRAPAPDAVSTPHILPTSDSVIVDIYAGDRK